MNPKDQTKKSWPFPDAEKPSAGFKLNPTPEKIEPTQNYETVKKLVGFQKKLVDKIESLRDLLRDTQYTHDEEESVLKSKLKLLESIDREENLSKALAFYAERQNWVLRGAHKPHCVATNDKGNNARAALGIE